MKTIKDKSFEQRCNAARTTKEYKSEMDKIKVEYLENGMSSVDAIISEMQEPATILNRWGNINKKILTILRTYSTELKKAIENERRFKKDTNHEDGSHCLRCDYTSPLEER